VLTGGSSRLQSEIDLMREGKWRALFVSGASQQVGVDEMLHETGKETPQWLACCIPVGHEARNTMGNATETAQWKQRQGYHSLRLVTSWYHMPRSFLKFKRAMPDVAIVPHPVFSKRVGDERWWARRGPAALLISEYVKYLATLLRRLFESSRPIGLESFETGLRQ
jgi:uncharacterized SAM-binding protein YcdF (DUF218 family)